MDFWKYRSSRRLENEKASSNAPIDSQNTRQGNAYYATKAGDQKADHSSTTVQTQDGPILDFRTFVLAAPSRTEYSQKSYGFNDNWRSLPNDVSSSCNFIDSLQSHAVLHNEAVPDAPVLPADMVHHHPSTNCSEPEPDRGIFVLRGAVVDGSDQRFRSARDAISSADLNT